MKNNNNDDIRIINASENNLKHVDITIPKNKLVVFAGVSGSGKSSLVFDTIAKESSRQWQAAYPLYVRNKMKNYERPNVEGIYNLTPSIVVDQKSLGHNGRSTVGTAVDVSPLLRLLFSRVGNPSAGGSMAYSTNHPTGACPKCSGIGKELDINVESLFDKTKSLHEGAIRFSQFSSGWQSHLYQNNPLLDPDKLVKFFSKEELDILYYGSNDPIKIEIRSNNSGRIDKVDYEGVVPRFQRLYVNRDISKLKKNLQIEIAEHVYEKTCSVCNGTGLNPNALVSKINGYNIIDFMNVTISELLPLMKKIENPIGTSIVQQLIPTLTQMIDVGIGYLSLSRRTNTLSGGELQRIKIVRNFGSSLNNITYIFDEPTAGLHPFDAEKIGNLLVDLRDKKNNVLIVEHSQQMLALADHIVELGPEAGIKGGQVVFEGNLLSLKKSNTSVGSALRQTIELNENPLPWSTGYEILNASQNNLKNIDVTIPKEIMTAVTGVAGSGKSSLIRQEFVKRYPEAIVIDQKPIGTSIRSTPATYTGVMDEIRNLFAKKNHVSASWFSFNSKGACQICKGKGTISYDMAFADSVTVVCEECKGNRYNSKALNYKFNGKSIVEVMDLTIIEAISFFQSEKINDLLNSLLNVGLGYLTLGQPTSTLSGGEVQRVKLASELHKKGNIYVLDEPSTGLHHKDIQKLLSLLRKLVNQNNTVILVEHRLELIAACDWIIDLGPGGGNEGGNILFSGIPTDIVDCHESKTGRYLKKEILI